MAIWIRDVAYLFAFCLLGPWLLIKTLRRRASANADSLASPHPPRKRWLDRFWGLCNAHLPQPRKDASKTIWLHGVSVGEVQLLAPIAEQLRTRYPGCQIAVSTTTATGMQVARRRFKPDILLFYFPLDFSWAVKRTLKTLQPDLIILGELELWPNLLAMCNAADIPVVIANGRLSERSFKGYQRVRSTLRGVFSGLSAVAAQTETYAGRFIECGVPEEAVTVTGSIKFDNAETNRYHERAEQFRRSLGITSENQIVVAGSTQVEEEQAILSAYSELKTRRTKASATDSRMPKLIIVPRHPERFDGVWQAVQSAAENLDVKSLRRSELNFDKTQIQSAGHVQSKPEQSQLAQSQPARSIDWDILLVDSLGELSSWWALADVALVGGTFGSRGGQNMIEPAAYGCDVVFGPRTENFRDVANLLLEHDAATRLEDVGQVTNFLVDAFACDSVFQSPGRQRGGRAAKLVQQQRGALERTLEIVDQCLSHSTHAPGRKAA
ncbi:MAG TPA: hypothetical protein DDW52_08635 [Planctomycetaceae bacterium]|nr:hypothetical protein [Planctomycetaceae bacterium]